MDSDTRQPSELLKENVVALKGAAGSPVQSQSPVSDRRLRSDDVSPEPPRVIGEEAKRLQANEVGKHFEQRVRPAASQKRGSFLRRQLGLSAVGLLAALLLGGAGYIYWDYADHFETTDDAFVEARNFSIAPKVAGYITQIAVTDNQHVKTGDLIARIDDRDFRVALEQAEAQVAAAAANIQNIDAQTAIQQAQITASQAQVEQAQAALTFAGQEATRFHDLAVSQAGTVQMEQQTASTLRQDQAALRNAQAALVVAQRQIESLKAQRSAAEASLAQAKAQRDQAKLNLSYTTITAAQAGRIVNLSGAVGQYAQAGTSFSMFVPDELWVIANYKETQLDEMRPGQHVTMRIDAYPNRVIEGHVDSVQPGSGTAFSLLPVQNATGNFVKIVQRVPVKLAMDNPPADVALGPGMSVVPSVRVNTAPSLFERLRERL
ncbi:HlyD family secretion protein [Pseudorhodoplanes sinuspersici]|uniref:Secretion protein HylD n=1 Tax=Pseudorhodoplanes sinuspersici TaxID=1235591 RepID=A0A1W6ZSD9_9HYPH|nr:HlyD family secretion protein [Pseudorhodoplanes sinuspersici]ARQ00307.1 secretion protein HylD [Pseudorhodoplanes sinuspersici]RKE67536.1 membrane fusion protein (multidrug efflux system) [Pseudorhodoplanes sinuspersici]